MAEIDPKNTKLNPLLPPFNLLIWTLRSVFEGGRKVIPQTRIFFFKLEKSGSENLDYFLVGDPEKKISLYYKPTFFRLQNHFPATLKITSKVAD